MASLVNGYLRFVAYDEEDLTGTELGEITDATQKSVLIEVDGAGAGEFMLNRISDQRQDCRPGRYIRVWRTDTIDETITGDPIFGFWVSESQNVVVSTDEYGGENYHRLGEGTISVLADAIAWYEAVTTNDAAAPDTEDDSWHWTAAMGAYAGGVMVRMLEEAFERGCFPFVTWDFDRTTDSNGDPWTSETAIDDFRIPVGTDLLSLAGDLQQLGLTFIMDTDFVLHAYETATYGTDVSGTVTFERTTNIAGEAEHVQIAAPARSTVLVKGTRGDNGETAWVEADSAAGLDEVKRRKEGFLDAGSTTGFNTLTTLGLESIYQKLRLRRGPAALPIVDQTLVPFTDYAPGDTVNVNVPGTWNDEALRLTALQLTDRETGDYEVLAIFDAGPSYQSKAAIPPAQVLLQPCCPPPGPFQPGEEPGDCSTVLSAQLGVGSVIYGMGGRTIHYGQAVGGSLVGIVTGMQYRMVMTIVSAFNSPLTGYDQMSGFQFGIVDGSGDGIYGGSGYSMPTPTDTSDVDYTGINVAYKERPPVGTRGAGLMDPGYVYETPWEVYGGPDVDVDVYLGGSPISGYYGGYVAATVTLEVRNGDGSAIDCGSGASGSPTAGQSTYEQAGSTGTSRQTNYPYMPGSLQVWVGGVLVQVIETDPTTGEFELPFDPGDSRVIVRYQVANSTGTGAGNFGPGAGVIDIIPPEVLPDSAVGLGWFNVKDYGATGDGMTDDTSAVNAAIAALNSADRGVLYFPAGAYKTTSALTAISAGQVLVRGDGMASFGYDEWGSSVINTSSTAVMFTINSRQAKFENIGLLSNSGGAPSAGTAVLVDSSNVDQRCDFDQVHVRGFYDNVDVKVGAHWTMRACVLTAPVRYAIRIRNTVNPDAGDWVISDCYIAAYAYNATSAIRVESSGGGKILGVKINEEAAAAHRFTTGIDVAIGAGNATSVMAIAGCSIENVSGDAISIAATSTGQYGLTAITGLQVGLYGNNTGYAVKLNAAGTGGIGSSGGIGNVVIDGGTFRTTGTARAAISLTNTDRVTIGDLTLLGFNARYTSSGDTNTIDGGSGGFSSPLTTRGDLLTRDASTHTRLAIGTTGKFLKSDGTDPSWQTVALDDLSDVTITSPAVADRLRYNGTVWVNSALIWAPVMVLDPGSGNYLVLTDSSGNAIMAEV